MDELVWLRRKGPPVRGTDADRDRGFEVQTDEVAAFSPRAAAELQRDDLTGWERTNPPADAAQPAHPKSEEG